MSRLGYCRGTGVCPRGRDVSYTGYCRVTRFCPGGRDVSSPGTVGEQVFVLGWET